MLLLPHDEKYLRNIKQMADCMLLIKTKHAIFSASEKAKEDEKMNERENEMLKWLLIMEKHSDEHAIELVMERVMGSSSSSSLKYRTARVAFEFYSLKKDDVFPDRKRLMGQALSYMCQYIDASHSNWEEIYCCIIRFYLNYGAIGLLEKYTYNG